ncbi:type VI secretion system-associated FHA domain protein TagH [Aggregatibacter actinomycetemcomitans]|uniref:type VI secretion system-associated FHA domain protein TagH n=1 Tax=Aggregatibacter actinomycetemcomitans TaxID=714 RepID=UPI00197C580D|nr:type VI secretion system-associated FHA domain protein TagH [Aggregatibacter actinomycetemcomitans]MBN6073735.1 type VI secretion system-associated FHA domain protein TagH [Aggregatibacter actinomycetemcomitans]MBN6078176.1 type VI secretion system-associated FHA domain protein TagH [Aggregatibacter actinomycetemcomitans]
MVGSSLMLTLSVKNVIDLESGKSRENVFTQDGGTIGSGENNHWVLQDLKANIPANQANIEWRDNAFCLQVIGKPLLVNSATFTPKSGFIRLKDGDQIKCGSLKLAVSIVEKNASQKVGSTDTIEDVVAGNQDYLKEILDRKNGVELVGAKRLADTVDENFVKDPIFALHSQGNNIVNFEDDNNPEHLLSSKHKASNSIGTLDTYGDLRMTNQSYVDLPIIKNNNESEEQSPFMENAYISISPLMREMDTKIKLIDSQETNDFLEEVGKTLKASIQGLLALQQEQNSLSDKHLRPIEDNPLRLNLDYATTMDVLFGDQKSPVHLAAPAAVSESLHNLLIHNEANRVAIISALGAILDAFSPQLLLQRFENYRRSNEKQNGGGAWAWEMYKNYYEELTSKRQYGFEKLFWEVYSQAYDKALRDKQNKENK